MPTGRARRSVSRGGVGARRRDWRATRLWPPSLTAESEGVLVFGTGDPDDAHTEASRGVRLNERVRCCRIDPTDDGSHGYSWVPLLDVGQQHTARRIAGIVVGLR